ncbi:MAG: cell division ATP-binding protein FtsE [Cytophagaceae bacterium]
MEFSSEPVVKVVNATIYQDEVPVLKDLNFQIDKGEFVYLIGRTGSGKSSLLKTLYADLPLREGNITVASIDLYRIKQSKVPALRRKIGIIFQDFQLLNDRSITENLIFVMKATGWKESGKIKQRLSEVLLQVGLSGVGNKLPHQLSGGEQQRVVIARALINEPSILIADEPTGNLDPEVAEDILKIFRNINRSGTSIFMATHNYEFLTKYPARVLKVTNGSVLDSGKEVFSFRHD